MHETESPDLSNKHKASFIPSNLPRMRRDESNISMISDIVKKKRITFLKSASLFADEDELFGSPPKPTNVRGSQESYFSASPE